MQVQYYLTHKKEFSVQKNGTYSTTGVTYSGKNFAYYTAGIFAIVMED